MIGRASYSVDVRRLRWPGAALLAGGAILAHLPSGVGLPCPFRMLTGLPCPLCGVTTSVRQLLGGHPLAAFDAAPLGLGVVALAGLAVTGLGPSRMRLPVVVWTAILLAEWTFELHRFHVF